MALDENKAEHEFVTESWFSVTFFFYHHTFLILSFVDDFFSLNNGRDGTS